VNLGVAAIVFGVVVLVAGMGVAVSSQSLLSMCRTGCWLNGLLYAFLGEHQGKFVLGGLWYAMGVGFIYRGVFGWRKERRG
jgi:4-amino-4-deoxy-L-arabinose transferase-like glycosyltransferase